MTFYICKNWSVHTLIMKKPRLLMTQPDKGIINTDLKT